jgi:hypothetical protein
MSRRILVQLSGMTEQLLARRGLSLSTPQARELLGDRTVSLLLDPEAKPPTRMELSAIIGLLTRLSTDPAGGPLPIPTDLVVQPGRRWPLPVRSRTAPQQREDSR